MKYSVVVFAILIAAGPAWASKIVQNQEKFKEMLRHAMDGQSFFPSEIRFATIMLGTAILVARKARDAGEIDKHSYNAFELEIFGTLRGQSTEQRRDARLNAFFA
jgi:hypothetical protein